MRIGLISLVEIWQIQYIKIKDKCQSLFFRISPLSAFPPNTPGNRAASQRDFPVRLSKKPRRVRGPQAANQVKSIFRGGVYVAKNTLRGESVSKWAKSPFGRAGRSEISFVKKGRRPFLTSSGNRAASQRDFRYLLTQRRIFPAGPWPPAPGHGAGRR